MTIIFWKLIKFYVLKLTLFQKDEIVIKQKGLHLSFVKNNTEKN